MEARLRQALARAEEVARELTDPALAKDPARRTLLGREHSRLAPIVRLADQLARLERDYADAKELAQESDPELVALARVDVDRLPAEIAPLRTEIEDLLVPRDPLEDRNAILEIRAGTGGDEAALFASELVRMYTRFAERNRLGVEMLSVSDGTLGGIKEAILVIKGPDAYGMLRREAGVHRSSGYRPPNRRAGFIPPPRRSPCFLRRTRST